MFDPKGYLAVLFIASTMYLPSSFVQNNGSSGSGTLMKNSSKKTDDGEVFYETAAAQGISGLFAALAILVSVHQVSNKRARDLVWEKFG